ncbi:MAG: hypothetical protein EOP61_13570 [Sphingomonadales bacterium]|nr:MAG: hypothetical protein EOP61_13570 [Sphingomonadales bacterium]
MEIVTATATTDSYGPLTQIALKWANGIAERTTGEGATQADWEQLSDCVATDEFKRVGAYLEELNWSEYLQFLTQWAGGGTRFEMTVLRISEIGNTVFKEIEERHYRGDQFIRKNVMSVYRFNADNKIVHLDIYEQARDSGQWIIDAARQAADD